MRRIIMALASAPTPFNGRSDSGPFNTATTPAHPAGLNQMSDAVAHAVITTADSPAVAAMAAAGSAIVQPHDCQQAGRLAA